MIFEMEVVPFPKSEEKYKIETSYSEIRYKLFSNKNVESAVSLINMTPTLKIAVNPGEFWKTKHITKMVDFLTKNAHSLNNEIVMDQIIHSLLKHVMPRFVTYFMTVDDMINSKNKHIEFTLIDYRPKIVYIKTLAKIMNLVDDLNDNQYVLLTSSKPETYHLNLINHQTKKFKNVKIRICYGYMELFAELLKRSKVDGDIFRRYIKSKFCNDQSLCTFANLLD